MNDDYSFYPARRRFMRRTGSMVALGSLPVMINTATPAFARGEDSLLQANTIVLFREEEIPSAAFAATLASAGLQGVALRDDPVRQWRDELVSLVAKGSHLIGLTSWPDYLLLSGQAMELQRRTRLHLPHHARDPAARNWAIDLARAYLNVPGAEEATQLVAFAQANGSAVPATHQDRTLFSWLIG